MADLKTHVDENIILGDELEFDLVDWENMAWSGTVTEFLSGRTSEDEQYEVLGGDPGRVYEGKIPVFTVWWNKQKACFEGKLDRLLERLEEHDDEDLD